MEKPNKKGKKQSPNWVEKRKVLQEKYQKTFQHGNFEYRRLRYGSIKFAKLYSNTRIGYRYSVAVIIGIFMAFAVQLFLKNTGLYNSGLSAIVQGLSRLTFTILKLNNTDENVAYAIYNFMFWGLYFIVNIPLFIFGFFKIGKTFSILTTVYVFTTTVVGLGLSYVPSISEFMIFGNTVAGTINDYGKNTNILVQNGIYILPFSYAVTPGIFEESDWIKPIFLFIYATMYGLTCTICYSMLYIIGSCSAGADFVAIFYSTIKQKPLGSTLVLINSLSMILGATLGSYVSAGMVNDVCWNWQFFISANLVASFISVIVFGSMLGRYFPLHKHVRVEVYSAKLDEIRKHLFEAQYPHTITIQKIVGGYSLQEKEMLISICMHIELPRLITHIRQVDKDCLISVNSICDIDGNVKVYQQGSME